MRISYKWWFLACAVFGITLIWFAEKNIYTDALKLASLILIFFPPKFVEKISGYKTNQKNNT